MDSQERRYRSLIRRYNAMRALALMGWFLFLLMLAWYLFARPGKQVVSIDIAGRSVAFVKDEGAAQRADTLVKQNLGQGLAGKVHLQPDDVKWTPTVLPPGEQVSSPEEAAKLIEPHVTAQVDAVAIQVGGRDVAYMDTMQNAQAVKGQLISQFVDPETVQGAPEIEPPLLLNPTMADPKQVETDIAAVVKKLIGSREESTTYVVKLRDNPSKIAAAHGISLAQLEAANPDLAQDRKDPNFVLVVGRKLKIPQKNAGLRVKWTQVVEKERDVPFTRIPVQTTALPRGEERTILEGQMGREKVRIERKMENNREVGRTETVLQVIKDRVNERYEVGVEPGGAVRNRGAAGAGGTR